jgi:hypothetical protein
LEFLRAEYEETRRAAVSPESAQRATETAERLRAQDQRVKDNQTLTRHLEHLIQYMDKVLHEEAPRP